MRRHSRFMATAARAAATLGSVARRGWLALAFFAVACTHSTPPLIPHYDGASPEMDAAIEPGMDAQTIEDAGPLPDRGPLPADAACATATASAAVEKLPVDIIWVVDNSSSMEPAIEQVQAGLNDFAALIGSRDLDYRVIMLSLRGRGATTIGGKARYQVCIPPPLANADCGDGSRFFHVPVDIRSTQPLEQFLGTLGQTAQYEEGDDLGSAPWAHLLRPEATKTIVVVSDDNARMVVRSGSGYEPGPNQGHDGDPVATADWFETWPGGRNLFNGTHTNTRALPEGVLHSRWGGLFDGYVFSALYGWGSETDDTVRCTFPGGKSPAASGRTYTELVRRTGGVRAKICDGAAAWGPFFDDVATAVEEASRIDCNIAIPAPPDGSEFHRSRINVLVDAGEGEERLGKVSESGACDERGGWHYDDEEDPSSVVLCPATCERLQAAPGETRRVDVQFGCLTIPI